MDLGLRGRTALVTGASKGIGFAVAESLAKEGCAVTLVARSATDLERAAARITGHGTPVMFEAADLSDSRAVDGLAERHGLVDILINNAGAIPGGRLHEIDEPTWRAAWDLKVFGYINMTRRFYAAMKARGRGTIINIVGAAGERVDAGYIAGSSGNAALIAFTRALGGSSAADGIRVTGINPGPVLTERLETLLKARAVETHGSSDRWREFLSNLPFGRAAAPEEIGALAAFLASDLSGYTTGSMFTVDGGMGARGSAY
ncbi:MAG: SDR family oxidoreductase [Acetobacteraceae bacterium]